MTGFGTEGVRDFWRPKRLVATLFLRAGRVNPCRAIADASLDSRGKEGLKGDPLPATACQQFDTQLLVALPKAEVSPCTIRAQPRSSMDLGYVPEPPRRLAQVTCTTLLIHGTADTTIPVRHASLLAEVRPRARIPRAQIEECNGM